MVMVVRGVGKWAEESRAHILFTVIQVDQNGFGVYSMRSLSVFFYVDVWIVCICVCVRNEHTTESRICAQARAIIATKTKEQKQNHVSNLKMVNENNAYYDINLNVVFFIILREAGDVEDVEER